MTEPRREGPVVIGGVGGSGTRLVARIALEVGIDLGPDLNDSLDNLAFTLLVKRPWWLPRALEERPEEVRRALDVFARGMSGPARLPPADGALVWRAAREMAWRGHDHRGRGRGAWPFVRAWRLLRGNPRAGARGWGWKEPNSHVVLEALAERFAGLRFVFVVRHGLDMAFSANRAQLHNWGPWYGVPAPPRGDEPAAMLSYWVRACERALAVGRERLGDRFLWVDYDALCAAPGRVLPALLELLGGPTDRESVERLAALPRRTPSHGRHREEDLSKLDPADVAAVRRLGFEVHGG